MRRPRRGTWPASEHPSTLRRRGGRGPSGSFGGSAMTAHATAVSLRSRSDAATCVPPRPDAGQRVTAARRSRPGAGDRRLRRPTSGADRSTTQSSAPAGRRPSSHRARARRRPSRGLAVAAQLPRSPWWPRGSTAPTIPERHTCDDVDVSPALTWIERASRHGRAGGHGRRPRRRSFVHWIVYGLEPDPHRRSTEGELPDGAFEWSNYVGNAALGRPVPARGRAAPLPVHASTRSTSRSKLPMMLRATEVIVAS